MCDIIKINRCEICGRSTKNNRFCDECLSKYGEFTKTIIRIKRNPTYYWKLVDEFGKSRIDSILDEHVPDLNHCHICGKECKVNRYMMCAECTLKHARLKDYVVRLKSDKHLIEAVFNKMLETYESDGDSKEDIEQYMSIARKLMNEIIGDDHK